MYSVIEIIRDHKMFIKMNAFSRRQMVDYSNIYPDKYMQCRVKVDYIETFNEMNAFSCKKMFDY